MPWGVLARGITDGFVIGQYSTASNQGKTLKPKGIWALARQILQGLEPSCPWWQLFHHYEFYQDEDDRTGIPWRAATTWRRPPCGIACISHFNRWEGRNAKVEREVRLAMRHRDE